MAIFDLKETFVHYSIDRGSYKSQEIQPDIQSQYRNTVTLTFSYSKGQFNCPKQIAFVQLPGFHNSFSEPCAKTTQTSHANEQCYQQAQFIWIKFFPHCSTQKRSNSIQLHTSVC